MEGMDAEQPQFDVAVEVFEIPDFGQNSEGESYAINALCGIKLGVAARRNNATEIDIWIPEVFTSWETCGCLRSLVAYSVGRQLPTLLTIL